MAKSYTSKLGKYGNKKTVIDGIKFDSKREAIRYAELLLLTKAGKVTGLTLQVPFVLAPAVRFDDESRAKPVLRYVADFVYTDAERGVIVVEDVKSPATASSAEFRIKRHLMLSVHRIQVQIVH